MTRLDLGSFLGMTQETVSRVMRGFDEAGVIRTHQKDLQILDVEKLHQIVEHSRHLTIP
jgi:CRP-like cAMP-binding protein